MQPNPILGQPLPSHPVRRQWIEVAVVLCLAVLPSILTGTWAFIQGPEQSAQTTPAGLVLSQYLFPLRVVPVLLFLVWIAPEGATAFGIRRLRVMDFGWAIVVWAILQASYRYLYSGFPVAVPTVAAQGLLRAESMMPDGLIALAVIGTMLSAFAEELVFRAFLVTRLATLLNSSLASVLGTSLLFGFVHLYQGWFPVLVIFVHGIIYGCALLWSRSVMVPTFAHAAWNLAILGIQLAHRK